jgi:hypothetical protein
MWKFSEIKFFFAKNIFSEGKLKYMFEYLGIYIYLVVFTTFVFWFLAIG